ncbi:hypothetical protein CAPTEDRAFT_185363 [Capitella teleta]|uniref:Uncharacterized protein n=1 Tax=Capitella teleta TaxID=283909 RepID=R7TAR5_CAPTE|nr:hypothetical protein CAPTEDRAFT_185363 [Capitella teleta]|eukprot:ELT90798.1 hypothetical protein CAPTEDRAFT_185363 [Capitella teleta]
MDSQQTRNIPLTLPAGVNFGHLQLTNVYTITSPFPKLPQLSLLVNSTIDVSIFHQSSSSLHLHVLSRRLEAGRSPCNKAQQLSSFESKQEHGKRRCTPPVYFKDYDTDGSGSLPRELKVDMQVPSAHSAKKGKIVVVIVVIMTGANAVASTSEMVLAASYSHLKRWPT